MKKLLLLCCLISANSLLGQSILLTPNEINKSDKIGTNDDVILNRFGTFPTIIGQASNGTYSAPTALSINSPILFIGTKGHDGNDFRTTSSSSIQFKTTQNWSSTAAGTNIVFSTTENNSTSRKDRMTINHDGKVGIGTSNPTRLLNIQNDGGDGILVKSTSDFTIIDIDAANGDAALRFASNGVNQWNIRNVPSTNHLQIFELGGGGSRLLIENGTGNIGVGTTSPKAKLHIFNGSSGISGTPSNELIVENSGNNYIQMMNPQTTEAGLLFGLPSSIAGGGIIYNNGERKALDFRTRNNSTKMTIDSTGNVGVGTTSPTAKLDINGDVVIKKKKVLPLTTQTVNNLDRAGTSVICTGVATSAQTITITGIDGGVDGMMLWIYPTNFFTIRLENEDTGSTATNRIKTTTGTANILSVRGGATLIYDGTEERWHVIDTN